MQNRRLLLVNGCLGVVISGNCKDLSFIVRVLGVELRVVHHRLVLTVRIRWILILVKEVAQMKKERGSDCGLASGARTRVRNLCRHRFRDQRTWNVLLEMAGTPDRMEASNPALAGGMG